MTGIEVLILLWWVSVVGVVLNLPNRIRVLSLAMTVTLTVFLLLVIAVA